ncbi:MAG: stage III sporulation protein AB [Caldicoprobacterales bacterium]|nr:stage III sporulation protein AB [Clostridiales bacterium]
MVIKLINSCVIILISTFIGLELARRYVARTRELSALQGALSRLETEILHYASHLPEALIRIGESVGGGTGRLFCLTGQTLTDKKKFTVAEAWSSSLGQLKRELFFQQEDLDILHRFGNQLGSSDREGQVRFIRLTLLQLREEEQKARMIRDKYEKMYRNLGILGGIALAILLL